MPKFKPYNQNQSMLLPPDVKNCLPVDHICFAINDVVDSLDISCIEQTYSENGAPAYDPRMLIKIIFFSYVRGIRSSRKIEEMLTENIVYRFLSANQRLDHGTINLFRKTHLSNLENIFAQIVRLCDGLKIIDPTDISVDGSVFKANASRNATHNQEDIEKLKKKIKKMLEEAEEIDRQEDEKYGKDHGYNEMPERLKDPKTRQEEIKRLIDQLSKLETAEQSIKEKQQQVKTKKEKDRKRNTTSNTTDTQAKLMKMKKGNFQPAYNGQIATNNQVIAAYDVVDENVDTNQLIPMIEKTESNTGKKVEKVKADSIYYSKENIEKIKEKEIDGYIPDTLKTVEEKQEKNNEIPKYDRRNFTYDKEKDEYICPQKQRLTSRGNKYAGVKQYVCKSCGNCRVKHKCTKGKHRYLQIDQQAEIYKTEMREKLNSKKGKAIYLERMSDVEPVFGNIIYNQKANNFLCRGKPKVKIEFGLACIAHNLVKISNWIKKENKDIKKLQLDTLMRLPATA